MYAHIHNYIHAHIHISESCYIYWYIIYIIYPHITSHSATTADHRCCTQARTAYHPKSRGGRREGGGRWADTFLSLSLCHSPSFSRFRPCVAIAVSRRAARELARQDLCEAETLHTLSLCRCVACCNILQHTATHCNMMQRTCQDLCDAETLRSMMLYGCVTYCKMLQHAATHCNMLQRTATRNRHTTTCATQRLYARCRCLHVQHTATHCNTLQHTATHCNTLQRTATHHNTLQHTATHCNNFCSVEALWGGYD